MIHRDIKGQNVLLTENAEVKLGKCDLMPARVESSLGITPVTHSALLEKWEPGLPLSTAPGPLCPCPRLPQQRLSSLWETQGRGGYRPLGKPPGWLSILAL